MEDIEQEKRKYVAKSTEEIMSLKDKIQKFQGQSDEACGIINEHQNQFQYEQIDIVTLKERKSKYKKLLDEQEMCLKEKEQEIKKLQIQLKMNDSFSKSVEVLNEILSNQCLSSNRFGIGYKYGINKKEVCIETKNV